MATSTSRQLFLDACADLAEELRAEGFHYRRSVPDLRMHAEEWQCEIRLQSTRYGNNDQDIDVHLNVNVSSDRVQAYREATGGGRLNGGVYGGYLEYLNPFSAHTPRNLAGPTRASTIATLVDRVRTGPLTALACLRSPATFVDSVDDIVLVRSAPGIWIDYLAAYDQRDTIPALLKRIEAGLRWNDGSVRDQRRILLDARRMIAGLPPVTDYNPSVARHLLESLHRADRTDDLLRLMPEPSAH